MLACLLFHRFSLTRSDSGSFFCLGGQRIGTHPVVGRHDHIAGRPQYTQDLAQLQTRGTVRMYRMVVAPHGLDKRALRVEHLDLRVASQTEARLQDTQRLARQLLLLDHYLLLLLYMFLHFVHFRLDQPLLLLLQMHS